MAKKKEKKEKEEDRTKLARAMAEECILVRIRILGRVITSLYDHAQRDLGVKANQSPILVFLTLHPGASPGEIGRALEMEKSTVSRVLERMRAKGWLEISPGGERGNLSVRLTPCGEQLLPSLYCAWQKAQDATRDLLGDDGVRAAHRLFDVLKQRGRSEGSDL